MESNPRPSGLQHSASADYATQWHHCISCNEWKNSINGLKRQTFVKVSLNQETRQCVQAYAQIQKGMHAVHYSTIWICPNPEETAHGTYTTTWICRNLEGAAHSVLHYHLIMPKSKKGLHIVHCNTTGICPNPEGTAYRTLHCHLIMPKSRRNCTQNITLPPE
jgi:hypothetical protein